MENESKFIPEEIAGLSNLEALYIAGNQISDLPDSLKTLKHLKRLLLGWIGGNSLRVFPQFIRHLSKLQNLQVNECELEALPD
jgi:internalin A